MIEICSKQKKVHAEIYPQQCDHDKRHGPVNRKGIAEIHKACKKKGEKHPAQGSKHGSRYLFYIFKLKPLSLKTVSVLVNERIRFVPEPDYFSVTEYSYLCGPVLWSSVRHPGVHERKNKRKDNKSVKEPGP